MTTYTHATILEAQNDGKPPNDNIEEGDKHIKAGKHKSDQLEYLDENNEIQVINFEPVETYDFGERMDSQTAIRRAKDRWFEENEDDES